MPSTKPTITLRLDPAVHDDISEIARITKQSKSAVLNDILSDVYPHLSAMRTAMTEAVEKREDTSKSVLRVVSAVQDTIRQQSGEVPPDQLAAVLASIQELAQSLADRKDERMPQGIRAS